MVKKTNPADPARLFDGLLGGPMRDSAQQFAEAAARAVAPWERLETIFDERVAKALVRLGSPGAAQLLALERRIEALEARLAAVPVVEKAAAGPRPKTAARQRSKTEAVAKHAVATREVAAGKPPTKRVASKGGR